MRNSNIVFNKIEKMTSENTYVGDVASYKGIGLKLLYYIGLTLVGAILGMVLLLNVPNAIIYGCVFSGIVTFICAIIAMSKPSASLVAGSIYCVFEGIFVGALSLCFEALYSGIILTAVLGTLSTVLIVSILYITGLVKVTNGFVKFLLMFSLGFIMCSIVTLILSFIPAFSNLFENYYVVILIEVVSLLLASFYLLFDLKEATRIVEGGSPKEYEWMAAFGIAYTVIWIYIQVLRIVATIAAKSDN